MPHKTSWLLSLILILAACTSVCPDIEVVCEDVSENQYILKWEILPENTSGSVKIYMAESPNHFDLQSPPIAQCEIADKICEIDFSDQPYIRRYFLLRFKNKYDYFVATRAPHIKDGSNFRDIGGYETASGQFIKWGKLYRSGSLENINKQGQEKFQSLQINTWIDFCDTTRYINHTHLGINQIFHFPINLITSSHIYPRLKSEKLRRGDANLFMQDLFLQLIDEGKSAFCKMFDIMTDDKNYPIVISDRYGKDYVGFAMAMILSTLDIPEDLIYRDFLLSNQYINRCAILADHDSCSTDTQEAATALMTMRKRQLFCAIHRIKQQHGTIQQYLQTELNLTPEKQEKIKSILLKQ